MDIIVEYMIGSYILLFVSLGIMVASIRMFNVQDKQDKLIKVLWSWVNIFCLISLWISMSLINQWEEKVVSVSKCQLLVLERVSVNYYKPDNSKNQFDVL